MGRQKKNLELRKKILVVCEGYTEVHYLNMLKSHFNASNVKVIPHKSKKTNAIGVIQTTLSNENFNKSDEVYAFFDKDDNSYENILKAIKLARDNDIEIAYSNTSFDLWILLHFKKVNAEISQKSICRELSQYFGCENYARDYKNNKDIDCFLIPNVLLAFENIKSNPNYTREMERSINLNPYQNIHLIIEKIFNITNHKKIYGRG